MSSVHPDLFWRISRARRENQKRLLLAASLLGHTLAKVSKEDEPSDDDGRHVCAAYVVHESEAEADFSNESTDKQDPRPPSHLTSPLHRPERRSRSRVSYKGLDVRDLEEGSDYKEPRTAEKDEQDGKNTDDDDVDDIDDVDEEALRKVDEEMRRFGLEHAPGITLDPGPKDPAEVDDDNDPELFDGNIRPLSYYRSHNKNVNENDYIRKNYRPGTLQAITHNGKQ